MAHVVLRDLPSQAARIGAVADVRRRRVVQVNLRGATGREQEKTRPCVVVSNDRLNKVLSTLIVVPITSHNSSGKVGAHEVLIKAPDGGLERDGAAQPCQVRTVDKFERVVEIWGELSETVMGQIEDMLVYVQSNS